jgi:hypothetical protein
MFSARMFGVQALFVWSACGAPFGHKEGQTVAIRDGSFWADGSFHGVPTKCATAMAISEAGTAEVPSTAQAARKRIALVLRGQSFRDWATQGVASSCCSQSRISQQEVYHSHARMLQEIERAGFDVDVFGATTDCSNGRQYPELLPGWYAGRMKALCIVSYRKGCQAVTFKLALSQAREYEARHGFDYAGYVVARFDFRFEKWDNAVLAATQPIDLQALIGSENFDQFFYIPGSWASTAFGNRSSILAQQPCKTSGQDKVIPDMHGLRHKLANQRGVSPAQSDKYSKAFNRGLKEYANKRGVQGIQYAKFTGFDALDQFLNEMIGQRYDEASGNWSSGLVRNIDGCVFSCTARAEQMLGDAASPHDECERRCKAYLEVIIANRGADNPDQCRYHGGASQKDVDADIKKAQDISTAEGLSNEDALKRVERILHHGSPTDPLWWKPASIRNWTCGTCKPSW